MKISENKLNKTVDYMVNGINHVVNYFDKRSPASKGEEDTQLYFAEELGNSMDNVEIQDFDLHPKSFMGWINITATCLILALIFYFFIPLISIILIAFGAFCMLSQLILYKEWLDPLFKKEQSLNVYATKKPKEQIKRRIILCGHADAAYEWHWHYKYGFWGFAVVLLGTVIGAFYLLGISIARLSNMAIYSTPNTTYLWLGIIAIPFIIFYLACYKFSDFNQVVDGANDNLTACFMALGVAKLLKNQEIELDNTELGVLITGSEEAGLRGARAFCKEYKEKLQDAETIFLCFETLREDEHLCLYTKEINGLYKTDEDVAKLVQKAGMDHDIEISLKSSAFAGTDSAAFGEYGLKSTCLAGLNHKLQKYYHTRIDSTDNLNPNLLKKVLKITLSTVKNYDTKGL